MPVFTTFISDEHDTEYTLEVTYDLLEADPDTGIMSAGAEITKVVCEEIKMHTAGDSRIIFPRDDIGEPANCDLGNWLGQWCLETFDEEISERAATSACTYEPDPPEYE
jgi:hypothetical protein